jgi:hypothetical protein
MPEPVTIAAASIGGIGWLCHSTLGAAALGGAIGNPTDRLVAATCRDLKTRFAGLRGSPANHDVARAVRIAQIQALESVIRNYREVGRPEWITDEVSRPEIFFRRGLDFCTRTIRRYSPAAKVKPRLEVTKELEKAIDGIMAEPKPKSDRPAGERLAEMAKLAEDAVLDELREELRGVRLPDGFEEHFRNGSSDRQRFLELFGVFLAEQIKHDPSFRAILTTGQLSLGSRASPTIRPKYSRSSARSSTRCSSTKGKRRGMPKSGTRRSKKVKGD